MAASVTGPEPCPALPETVSQSTRLYLRPLGLIAGAPAERLLATGQAVRLAGRRFAFGACQVLFREGPRITGTIAPMDEIRAWSDFLEDRVEVCVAAGIGRGRLIVDPGIGFGKNAAHNLAILGSLTLYHGIGCPFLLGISRKGLAGEEDRERPPKEGLPAPWRRRSRPSIRGSTSSGSTTWPKPARPWRYGTG